jgi:hypothetical protein
LEKHHLHNWKIGVMSSLSAGKRSFAGPHSNHPVPLEDKDDDHPDNATTHQSPLLDSSQNSITFHKVYRGVLRGEEAQLSNFRLCTLTSPPTSSLVTTKETSTEWMDHTALQELLDPYCQERLLMDDWMTVRASWWKATDSDEECYNESEENDALYTDAISSNESISGNDHPNKRSIVGRVMVTSERLLLCAVSSSQSTTSMKTKDHPEDSQDTTIHDWIIHGTSIELHALSDGPPHQHVYVQVHYDGVDTYDGNDNEQYDDDNSNDEDNEMGNQEHASFTWTASKNNSPMGAPTSLWEFSLTPVVVDATDAKIDGHDATVCNDSPTCQDLCEKLYHCLSQLVSLHPVDPNDCSDDDGNGLGPFMTADSLDEHDSDSEDGLIMNVSSSYRHGLEDTTGLVITNANSMHDDEDEEDQAARMAMLERLDRLLIVPPEYEVEYSNDDDDDNDHMMVYLPTEQQVEGQFDDAEED